MNYQQNVLFFLFPLNSIYEQKSCKTGRQKSGLFCVNSSKIYKKISGKKLNRFWSSVIPLLFLNIKKNLWSTLCCIAYYKELFTKSNYTSKLNKSSNNIKIIYPYKTFMRHSINWFDTLKWQTKENKENRTCS